MSEECENTRTRVTILEKNDLRQDIVLSKLSDISQNINEILIRHEAKTTLNEEISSRAERSINEFKKEIIKRLDALEKFKWILFGAAAVMGVIIGPIISHFGASFFNDFIKTVNDIH